MTNANHQEKPNRGSWLCGRLGQFTAMCATVLCAFSVSAETYYLAGTDEGSASAMIGTGSYGWTDTDGTTTKTHNPSEGNDYVVAGNGQTWANLVLRTPTVTDKTFGGDSLTLKGKAEIKVKVPNNGVVTIPNLIIDGEAQIVHGDGNQTKAVAGAISVNEGAYLKLIVSYDNATTARMLDIRSSISGAGEIWAGLEDDKTAKTPFVKFSGSMADFTGKLTFQSGKTVASEVYFYKDLPGDPAVLMEDGFTLVGKPLVKFMSSGTLGYTRGVTLSSEVCEIYVDAGKTVQINGLVTGAAGFRKTGAGTLALASVSPGLSGTITVAAGTLQLCDIKENALPNATVTVSSGATLDENGPVFSGRDMLLVTGEPSPLGVVSPAYGPTRGLAVGKTVACSAMAWTNAEETVATTCVGYKVYTNGVVYVEGKENSFTYEHPNCEKGAELVWQWSEKRKVVPTVRGSGSASVSGDGWFASGETATVTAVPAEGWSFKCWEGDVPEEQKFNAALHLPVGTTLPALTAVFGESFFVSTTGDDSKSGRSWGEALATVEAALEKGGDAPCINVAEGLYEIQTAIKVTTGAAIVGSGERGAVFRLAAQPVAGDDTRAVFYVANDDAVLRNLALTTGGAERGRGLYLNGGTVAYCAITNCVTVNGNMDGGGVYLKTGTLRDSLVHYNQASSSGNYQKHGGGIYMAGGLADRCVIRDNYVCYYRGKEGSGHGGGVWMNAGTLRNSLVCGNVALSDASGVYAESSSSPCIESCTIVNNGTVSKEISGVHLKGKAMLMNSIAWGAIGQTSEVPNLTVDGTTVTLANNITDKGTDPVFIDAANGDFRIGFGPCVDQGVDQDWMVGATDLAGQERIQGERVDIGCYEYTPKSFEVDIAYERLSAFYPGDVRFTANAGGATLDESASWWTFDGREPTAADYDAIGSTVTRTMTPGEYTVRFKTVYDEKAYEVKKEKWFVLYGETVYVNPNCTRPAVPYASWETAATNINDALKCLVAGSTMVVSDGVYRVTSEQNLDRQVTIRSLNGPTVTKFTGSRPFHLNSSLATVAGFAFEKLDMWDGGAMRISNGTVSNCVFASCVIQNNGGAAVYMTEGTVVDCVVTNCSTRYSKGQLGAAIHAKGANAFIDRCIVTGSYWQNAYTNNAAVALEGGAKMRNSVVADNRGGATGGVLLTGASAMENCTVTGNTAYFADGVGGVSAADTASVVNTIIWSNMNAKIGEASEKSGADTVYDTCCTEDPVFRGGKVQWRLKAKSPCMNAGKPLDWMDGAKDVYGNPRVLYGKPDIGAVESPYEPGLVLMVR